MAPGEEETGRLSREQPTSSVADRARALAQISARWLALIDRAR